MIFPKTYRSIGRTADDRGRFVSEYGASEFRRQRAVSSRIVFQRRICRMALSAVGSDGAFGHGARLFLRSRVLRTGPAVISKDATGAPDRRCNLSDLRRRAAHWDRLSGGLDGEHPIGFHRKYRRRAGARSNKTGGMHHDSADDSGRAGRSAGPGLRVRHSQKLCRHGSPLPRGRAGTLRRTKDDDARKNQAQCDSL